MRVCLVRRCAQLNYSLHWANYQSTWNIRYWPTHPTSMFKRAFFVPFW